MEVLRLKMKIQAMCWVTSSKVVISNVQHNQTEWLGWHTSQGAQPPPPYIGASVPVDRNFDF